MDMGTHTLTHARTHSYNMYTFCFAFFLFFLSFGLFAHEQNGTNTNFGHLERVYEAQHTVQYTTVSTLWVPSSLRLNCLYSGQSICGR